MTSPRTVVVAAMHLIATRWIAGHKADTNEPVTYTEGRSLRGFPPDTPIIVVDSRVPFTDIPGMQKALERFTDVRHVNA